MRFFFFFTLVTGPRRSLSLKLSDTRVYEDEVQGEVSRVPEVSVTYLRLIDLCITQL